MAAINANHLLVFLRTWKLGDAIRIFLHIATVVLALPLLGRRPQQLVQSTLVVVTAGVLLSLLGADVAHNVLVTQVQAWRGLWILAALATVLLGVLLHSVWRLDCDGNGVSSAQDLQRAASLLLLLAWFTVEINATALAFVLLAALLWKLPRFLPGVSLPPDTSMRWAWDTIVTTGVPGLLVLVGLAHSAASRGSASVPASAFRSPTAAAGLIVLALLVMDSRTQYQRYVERELDARANGVPAPVRVPRGSTVLWPDADMEPWAFAGAPSWGMIVQGMPSVFDRQLAIVWARRTERIKQAGLLSIGQTAAGAITVPNAVVDDKVTLRLCTPPDAARVLVLPNAENVHVSQASTFYSAVARALYPTSIGQRWLRIDAYSVVWCVVK